MPTWDPVENVNKPCASSDHTTFLTNVETHQSCSWDTYKVESDNKTTAVNNAAAAASAQANIDAAAAAVTAAETAATEAAGHKTTAETALADCDTAKTANNTTDSAAALAAAEAALASATTSLGTATTELGKAQAANTAATNEYNLNPTDTNLLNAKNQTAASVTTAQGHVSTCETLKSDIETIILSVKACNYTTISNVNETEAETQKTTASTKKTATTDEEAKALTAKTSETKADLEAAETAASGFRTEAATAATASDAAAVLVENAKSSVQTLLNDNAGNADLTTALGLITTSATNARASATQAETHKDDAEVSYQHTSAYLNALRAKEYKTTATNEETSAETYKTQAEGYLADVNTAKGNGDQAAADTAATNANTASSNASTSANNASAAATTIENILNTVNTAKTTHSGDAILTAMYNEIDGYKTTADTSAANAKTHSDAAATAASNAQTAASASNTNHATEAETSKTTASTEKGNATTAEGEVDSAVSANNATLAQTKATEAKTAATAAQTAATEAAGHVASAKTDMDNAKAASDASPSDTALKTAYTDALEVYNTARIHAVDAEILAVEAVAIAVSAQNKASAIATDQTAETWDTHSTYAKDSATAIQTAATNLKDLAVYFQVETENYLIALDTSSAATSKSRATTAEGVASSLATAMTTLKTAADGLKTNYDTALSNNSSNVTLSGMESTMVSNQDAIFISETNVTIQNELTTIAKNNAQAAVDGNADSDYSSTAESKKSTANSEASTATSKQSTTNNYASNGFHSHAVSNANLTKTAALNAENAFMAARSAMRIAETVKTNAFNALSASGTQADYDTALEDFEAASLAAGEAEVFYAKAYALAAEALTQANNIDSDLTTVAWVYLADFSERAAKIAETAASTAKDLTSAFKTETNTHVTANDSTKANAYNTKTASAYTNALNAETEAGNAKDAADLVKTNLDAAATANSSSTVLASQQTLVNTVATNADTSKTNAEASEAAALTLKNDAQALVDGMLRILEAVPVEAESSEKNADLEGRILSTCPNNHICVTDFNEVDLDKYTYKYDFSSNGYTGNGGCKFVCEKTQNAKPTPVNDNASDTTLVNNCYNSCSIADSLERCVNGQCVKNCQIDASGHTINCNENEVCTLGTGGADNTCTAKPCEPPCDANYETCDSATNRCSLLPRKPKIQALTTCTKVENCDAKYHLNRCYQCSNYYSFKIPSTGNTAANPSAVTPELPQGEVPTCVHTNIPNALMASEYQDGDITKYKVEKCAPGYDLDFNNNECVSKIKNCKLNSVDGDCLGCDTPYETGSVQLVFGIFEKGYCKTWGEFDSTEQAALTPPYQEHCKYYRYTYTNTSNVTSLKDGASICYECDPDYYFADTASGKVCTLRRTDKCKTYDSASTTGTCVDCEAGYELKFAGAPNQECKEIVNSTQKIPGCSIYDINLNCLACEAGYLFRKTGEGSSQTGYCFIEFVDEACSAQNETVFAADGTIQCQKCKKVSGIFYYPRKFNTAINACMFIGKRNLCLNHDFDKADSLNLANTFRCTLCEIEYYLANGVCIRRLNTEIKGCITYHPDKDECKTFESSAPVVTSSDEFSNEIESIQNILLHPPDYLTTTKTINFEGWILSCEVYLNETACSKCYAPKYINEFGFEYNTKCITATETVNNCVHYSDAVTCQECFYGYTLINNECKLITVENCATYKSENECATCPANYPYLDGDGNCTVDPRNMFCLTYIISNETVNLQASKIFECDICLENYYPDDSSICTMVETEIPNCKYYAGDGLCKECKEGFFLNFDGKNCFINPSFDPFCKVFTYLTECAICEKGYYLDEDANCVACNPETFPAGCLYCDPADHATCLICDFGYEMKAEGCVKNSAETSGEPFIRPFNYFIGQTKAPVVAQSGLLGRV